MTSEYLQQVCVWLAEIEQQVAGLGAATGDAEDSAEELRDAIGAAQVAIARILAERQLLT